MLIVPSQVAFTHVQKTGGHSIDRWLRARYHEVVLVNGMHCTAGAGRTGLVDWDTHYSFGFVRNPWDRVAAWWRMFDRESRAFYGRSTPFTEFLKRQESLSTTDSIWRPQVTFFESRPGCCIVNHIGRYETFEESLGVVAKNLGVALHPVPKLNAAPNRVDYRSFYTDETAELVGLRFVRDTETFGYSFDGSGRG